MSHLYSHAQSDITQQMHLCFLIIVCSLLPWGNSALANESKSHLHLQLPQYPVPMNHDNSHALSSTNLNSHSDISDYWNPFSVGYIHRSHWLMLYDNVELGGGFQLFEQSNYLTDDSSYIRTLHSHSYQYLGWGVKVGKQLTLTSRFTAFLHAGAFNWSREHQANMSNTGRDTGTAPYAGVELTYSLSSSMVILIKLEHFSLENDPIGRFGFQLSYQF